MLVFPGLQVTLQEVAIRHSTDCAPSGPCWHALLPSQRTVHVEALPQSTPKSWHASFAVQLTAQVVAPAQSTPSLQSVFWLQMT